MVRTHSLIFHADHVLGDGDRFPWAADHLADGVGGLRFMDDLEAVAAGGDTDGHQKGLRGS